MGGGEESVEGGGGEASFFPSADFLSFLAPCYGALFCFLGRE